jgi:hypothetical protein
VSSKDFGHLPAWNELVCKKKKLMKFIWINGFFLGIMILSITNNIWDKFEENWIKALIGLLLMSVIIMFISVFTSFFLYSIFSGKQNMR